MPAANAALERAYLATNPQFGPHKGPWVTAERAQVDGDAARGFVVRWSSHPPAGFEHDAEVRVSATGEVKVVRAEASFSPD